jgi:Tol biopolymer transport system component
MGQNRRAFSTPYRQNYYRLSPDGKYVVYASDESGPTEIYVAAFPSFLVKRKVSNGPGQHPMWASGGQEMFYRSLDGSMMSVTVRTSPTLEIGTPKLLFKFGTGTRSNIFAVSRDGKRFLLAERMQESQLDRPEISVVINWAADIK